MRRSRIAVLAITCALILSLAAPAGALNLFDKILYMEKRLATGTRVLVHRITGRVDYYWQQGFSQSDDGAGVWVAPVKQLKEKLQQQYDQLRGR